jgi:phosphopantothenoylcysteine decarboxylase/phosphopantothenate--cysteine ligase
VIVAPTTANVLAKAAAGIADDLLTTTLLVATCPIMFAPAMHTQMWQNAATQANVTTLRARGLHVMEPAVGRLTGKDSGPGRMPEPEEIFGFAQQFISSQPSVADSKGHRETTDLATPSSRADSPTSSFAPATPSVEEAKGRLETTNLAGQHVVITAGGTREPIDPVRWIGNRSTGKQGVALAVAALERGAKVTLIAANIDQTELAPFVSALSTPAATEPKGQLGTTGNNGVLIEVETCLEMLQAVRAARPDAAIVIMAAAVADYRPLVTQDSKVKKIPGEPTRSIELVENPDILKELCAERIPGQVVVGFAAETGTATQSVLELGQEKALRKGADLLAVNEVGSSLGFGTPDNHVWLLNAAGAVQGEVSGSKAEVAQVILSAASSLLAPN